MRYVSVYILAFASLLALAMHDPLFAEVEVGAAVKPDACIGDDTKLGVSRVVEIDTEGGVDVGGEKAGAKQFLNDGEVVLTFDDGPMKSVTGPILKALADQCTKATFFMVGQMALANPEMVKEVAAAGHTVGSHTWSHKNIHVISLAKAQQEIEAAISTVSKAKGTPVAPLFRFPYLNSTKQTEAYLRSRNIGAVWIDVDSKDYRTRSAKVVEQNILSQLAKQKKGIILMHDIHAWTAAQLPDLLKELHDRGYKVVQFVPKGQIETIASYDAAAEKALAAKAAAKAANPMVSRSIVWPMSSIPGTDLAAVSPTGTRLRAGSRYKRVATKPTIVDGVADDSAPVKIPVSKYKKTAKPKDETSSWGLFN
ncbi:polysaccharide deacetylase family protein [Hyphomicrobium sp.]|jgi:peptidoglycan/xylan/chitin deacetylase (PgdA/CDA1 family)|uniref:polysaccharide deacetylase family protein n=1 Tax=Hyphomicrobium sp. TaxID=82 RepID=UPI0035690F01